MPFGDLDLGLDLSPRSGGGGVAPVIPTEGVLAANRGQFPTDVANIANDTVAMREVWFSPEGDVTNPIVHHVNTYITDLFGLTNGSVGTFSAYLEYPLGVFTQLTYNGGSLTYGATGVVSSDPVPGVTGLAGTRAWVHTRCHSGGTTTACVELPANADTIGVTDTKYAWTGSPSHPAPQASTLFFGANAVTGTIAKTNARAFGITGHSIPFAQGDISGSGPKGGSGGHARGLDNRYPYVKICKGGMDTANMAALRGSSTIATFIRVCGLTDVIQDFTGGDLRNGNTVDAIKENIQTVFGMFGNCKRFYLVTALDRTDSTDGYATTVNQTPKTDGNWINQITLNTDIRAGLPRVTAVLDICSVTSSSFNSGVWPGSPARTTDGVHPNTYECLNVIAPYVNSFDFVIPAPGAWTPADLGYALAGAWDTNDVNQVTVDGSNNLVRMRATYGGGDLLPGSSPDVSLVGGVASNKRVITFAAGEYLQTTDARILAAGNGVVASGKLTVIEALKFVSGATSRGFMFGTIGGASGAPSIGIRQTTTNRGPSATPVTTAYTAFQAAFDGNWHTHTVTLDGLNLVYRVDGVQVATGTLVGGTNWGFTQLLIGAVVGAVAGTPGSVNPLSAHAGMLIADTILSGTDLTNSESWVGATAGL
ncbi:hypothetical protein HFO65_15875 [Rhizobium laguerreae]|uniref:hypothetical protein n=1 Tax=Rhizobium laguerreae TaxID=1076926 RepID=UPI001C900746|nr:hypothetical protein [Rhizobium laguerreae]MBY3162113.1 hypothetical protein [Rhizobium laguerreae]